MSHVLLLFEHTSLNGGERSFLVLLEDLQSAGTQFQAVAPPSGPLVEVLSSAGVKTLSLPFLDNRGNKRDRDELRRDLAGIIQQTSPDLLHANSLTTSRLAGPVAEELGVRSIGHLRDILKLNAAAISDLNCHARVLAVSQATREYHVAQGLRASHTYVAFNGVDVHRFCPRAATGWLHDELSLSPDIKLIGGVGQIILRKGWDVWLDAAARVVRNNPHAHFVLIGKRHSDKLETRELEQHLFDTSHQAPLNGHIHFLGARDRMELLLPELAVLAHAARQEPFGRVLLEAAACGVPVVATDVGGTREIFGHAAPTADLTPVDDSERLAAGITKVLANPAICVQQAEKARKRVSSLFHHRRAAESLANHYRAILD